MNQIINYCYEIKDNNCDIIFYPSLFELGIFQIKSHRGGAKELRACIQIFETCITCIIVTYQIS